MDACLAAINNEVRKQLTLHRGAKWHVKLLIKFCMSNL